MADLVPLLFCVFVCLRSVIGEASHVRPIKVDPDCRCGIKYTAASRIVGGEEAAEHEFPWQALLTYERKATCGGIIINNLYVLLAGHCYKAVNIYRNGPQIVEVKKCEFLLGMHEYSEDKLDGVLKIRPEKFILHPDYDYTNLLNDIALAKLKSKIEFSFSIVPACLPHFIPQNLTEHPAVVSGWGAIKEGGSNHDILKKATVYIKDGAYCKYYFKTNYDLEYVVNTMLCAYDKYGDACQGDSGGPLVAAFKPHINTVIGIVSNGAGCGRIGIPGIYTKVSAFMDFIMENTRDSVFCTQM